MEPLSQLRQIIASLDEALVDSLCNRAQRRRNESLYARSDAPMPELRDLAGQFADVPTTAGRIQLLRLAYLHALLPVLCEPGTDPGQAECLSADGACLDALARRLALSVHVATRKREALPEALQTALGTGDPGRVEEAITYPSVEAEVIARVKARAAARTADPTIPDRIARLYADWIIPLSRKIQVHGLLAAP